MSIVSYETFTSRNNAHYASVGLPADAYDKIVDNHELYQYSLTMHALFEDTMPGITEKYFGESTYKVDLSETEMVNQLREGMVIAKAMTKDQVLAMIEVTIEFMPTLLVDKNLANKITPLLERAKSQIDEVWAEVKPIIDNLDEKEVIDIVVRLLGVPVFK